MKNTLSPRAQKYFERYAQGVIIRDHTLELYNHFLQNAGENHSLQELVSHYLEKKERITLLDIGCGNAHALFELKKIFGKRIHTVGIDLHVPPEGNIDEFIQGDANEVPLPAHADIILSFRALHEIGSLPQMIERIAQSLSAGGRAYLWVRLREENETGTTFAGEMTPADESFVYTLSRRDTIGPAAALVDIIPLNSQTIPNPPAHNPVNPPAAGAIIILLRDKTE